MRFEFRRTKEVNTIAWSRSNLALERDLLLLSAGKVSEEEITEYLTELVAELRPIENREMGEMLFLMYAEPASMPSDARVEFVYRPTYIAATIMMTAMNRFESVYQNPKFQDVLPAVLNAAIGRNFLGSGHDRIPGLLDTLQIFAEGDTAEFIARHPEINEKFTSQFAKAITFLETEICSGNAKDEWTRDSYAKRGNRVLALLK